MAPLWAGLIARINQKKGGRVGFINPAVCTPSRRVPTRFTTSRSATTAWATPWSATTPPRLGPLHRPG